eukprot:CAMPEP_0168590434 /NCGR_PEP_ID=MMETSP0420-20121227/6566_1 /TAXON_ID=498008 /ORGANISM="Pessonella sp." /LENGTH=386 /DNA_ID=CAMNT_0008626093 /DNA_START=556 /DNA_END=1716 /DNA_ORIENTATION=-
MSKHLADVKARVPQGTLRLALEKLDEALLQTDAAPAKPVSTSVIGMITFKHLSFWVAGRYNKYDRTVSQSPWRVQNNFNKKKETTTNGTTDQTKESSSNHNKEAITTIQSSQPTSTSATTATTTTTTTSLPSKNDSDLLTRIGSGSVEEVMVEPILNFFRGSSHALRSAGREDMDVRMLGDGRPFVIEVIDPRRLTVDAAQLQELQRVINERGGNTVRVRCLQLVPRSDAQTLGDAAATKRKVYRCLVQCSSEPHQHALDALAQRRDIVLQQNTPIRVAHRRALLLREKIIHRIQARKIGPRWLSITMSTSAGTYVKEFINGDLGRTEPSFAQLINVDSASMILLDVLAVGLEFPSDAEFNATVIPPPPKIQLFGELPKDNESEKR